MRVYWLANHTAGASWDTVAQLCYCEDWDLRMAAVTDSYTPLQTWDDKVATAMRSIHQDKHLSKDGVPLGPINQRLTKKSAAVSVREQPRSRQCRLEAPEGQGTRLVRGPRTVQPRPPLSARKGE